LPVFKSLKRFQVFPVTEVFPVLLQKSFREVFPVLFCYRSLSQKSFTWFKDFALRKTNKLKKSLPFSKTPYLFLLPKSNSIKKGSITSFKDKVSKSNSIKTRTYKLFEKDQSLLIISFLKSLNKDKVSKSLQEVFLYQQEQAELLRSQAVSLQNHRSEYRIKMPADGLEPSTVGLQNRCSTN
jgi:hypothetical protein